MWTVRRPGAVRLANLLLVVVLMLGLRLLRRIVRGGRLLFWGVIMTIFVGANCLAISGAWMSDRMRSSASQAVVEQVESTARSGPLPGVAQHDEPEPRGYVGSVVGISAALLVLLLAGGVAVFGVLGASSDDDEPFDATG